MLTLKLITEETDRVIRGLEKKHFKNAKEAIDEVLAVDKKRREAQQQLDKNLAEAKKLAAQIELYKKLRDVLQFGQFYRIRSGNVHEWVCVSNDKTRAVGMMLQELVQPNTQAERFFARGLDPEKTYRFYNILQRVDIKQFGSLVNTIAPFHVKQDSMVHNMIAKAVNMKGEAEDAVASGMVLMSTGVALKPAFSGTGFNENVRVFPDFSLRMYFVESQ